MNEMNKELEDTKRPSSESYDYLFIFFFFFNTFHNILSRSTIELGPTQSAFKINTTNVTNVH